MSSSRHPAFYDLRTQPASWDFWCWLAGIGAHRVHTVAFDTTQRFKYKEPQEIQQQLFDHVVLEICDLFNLMVEYRPQRDGDLTGHHIVKSLRNVPQFDLDPVGRPTVTLRHTHKHQHRNSEREVWLEFAKEIDAHVIEDAFDEPISVKERIELYRRAPMNYGIIGGPMAACLYSNLPAMVWHPPAAFHECYNLKPGNQYPWSMSNQTMIWETPTLDSLRKFHLS